MERNLRKLIKENKKNIFLWVILLCFTLFGTNILLNVLIGASDKAPSGSLFRRKQMTKPENESAGKAPTHHKLKRSNPEDYGIKIIAKANRPRTQLGWDHYIETATKESGVLENKKVAKAFENVQMSPEEYQEKIDFIDARIKSLENTAKDDPSNREAESKLQHFYMMRSIARSFKEKIIDKTKKPPNQESPPQKNQQESSDKPTPSEPSKAAMP